MVPGTIVTEQTAIRELERDVGPSIPAAERQAQHVAIQHHELGERFLPFQLNRNSRTSATFAA